MTLQNIDTVCIRWCEAAQGFHKNRCHAIMFIYFQTSQQTQLYENRSHSMFVRNGGLR